VLRARYDKIWKRNGFSLSFSRTVCLFTVLTTTIPVSFYHVSSDLVGRPRNPPYPPLSRPCLCRFPSALLHPVQHRRRRAAYACRCRWRYQDTSGRVCLHLCSSSSSSSRRVIIYDHRSPIYFTAFRAPLALLSAVCALDSTCRQLTMIAIACGIGFYRLPCRSARQPFKKDQP
jgi:hypothetical protein